MFLKNKLIYPGWTGTLCSQRPVPSYWLEGVYQADDPNRAARGMYQTYSHRKLEGRSKFCKLWGGYWKSWYTSLHCHLFWYARVLGIYHVNVIYIGEGNVNYLPCRLDFLWVQWYVLEDEPDTGQLDHVSFPPLSDNLSFRVLDPDDILQVCHIIPVFWEGLACENGPGLSFCDQDHDHKDWKSYVVNRWAFSGLILSVFLLNYCSFVDRNMAMWYHWGHGVGHTYSHHCWDMQEASSSNCQKDAETGITQENLSPTTQGNPSPLESRLTNTGGRCEREFDFLGVRWTGLSCHRLTANAVSTKGENMCRTYGRHCW